MNLENVPEEGCKYLHLNEVVRTLRGTRQGDLAGLLRDDYFVK